MRLGVGFFFSKALHCTPDHKDSKKPHVVVIILQTISCSLRFEIMLKHPCECLGHFESHYYSKGKDLKIRLLFKGLEKAINSVCIFSLGPRQSYVSCWGMSEPQPLYFTFYNQSLFGDFVAMKCMTTKNNTLSVVSRKATYIVFCSDVHKRILWNLTWW